MLRGVILVVGLLLRMLGSVITWQSHTGSGTASKFRGVRARRRTKKFLRGDRSFVGQTTWTVLMSNDDDVRMRAGGRANCEDAAESAWRFVKVQHSRYTWSLLSATWDQLLVVSIVASWLMQGGNDNSFFLLIDKNSKKKSYKPI